jgi:hypothetical protein
MNEEIKEVSLKQVIEKYSLNLIRHEDLDNDTRFTYLRDQLLIHYKKLYSEDEPLEGPSSVKYDKNLIYSLQELLMQTIYTPKAEDKLTLLDKVYKWYTSKASLNPLKPIIPLEPIQAIPTTPSLKIKGRLKTISLPAVEPPKSTPSKPGFIQFPKRSHPKSKDDIVSNIESRYYLMLNSEKINLQTTEHRRSPNPPRSITPLTPVTPLTLTTQHDPEPPISKKTSKTPDFEQVKEDIIRTPSIDFRNFNHKFRFLSGINKRNLFNKISNSDLAQIHSMKGKLARKKVKISVKEIETGIIFDNFVQDDDEDICKNLPKGGEMLLKKKKFKKKRVSLKSSKGSNFFV